MRIRILAIDPGNTTGVASYYGGRVWTSEIPGGFPPLVEWLNTHVGIHGLPDLLVVERWITTGQKITYQPAAQQGWGYVLGKGIEWGIPTYDPRAVDHKKRSGVKKPRREKGNHILTLGWAPKTPDRHQEDAASLVLDALYHYDRPTYDAVMAPIYTEVWT